MSLAMSISENLERGLLDLVLAAAIGGWLAYSLKVGWIYLKPLGRATRAQSAPVFWTVCAGLALLTAMLVHTAIRLIARG